MRRFGFGTLLAGWLAVLAVQPVLGADTASEAPDFQEVYQLIKAHVPGVSDAELNRAAIQGLFAAFGAKVSLVTNGVAAKTAAETPLVSKADFFDAAIAYLRIGRVADGLASEVQNAYHQLSSTNKLKGVVLDLRYASGADYAAAAAAADLFIGKALPLLDWGNGVVSSREKTNAIQLPVAILVNGETAGAAEALAAALRSAGAGLILGGKTAGRSTISQEFPLKGGGRLRVATAPVRLGNGDALSSAGIKPDIDVTVSVQDERVYYADAFYAGPKTRLPAPVVGSLTNQPAGSNNPRRARLNEAELVRERRLGLGRDDADEPRLIRESEPERPVMSDPALARAVDLLKGLAVVRQSGS